MESREVTVTFKVFFEQEGTPRSEHWSLVFSDVEFSHGDVFKHSIEMADLPEGLRSHLEGDVIVTLREERWERENND